MNELFQKRQIMAMIGVTDLDYKQGKTIAELEHDSIE